MSRARTLTMATIALAGLLVGVWVVWPNDPEPPARVAGQPRTAADRPADAIPRDGADDGEDTAGPAPAPAEGTARRRRAADEDDGPVWGDLVPTGIVRCPIAAHVGDVTVSVLPDPAALANHVAADPDFDHDLFMALLDQATPAERQGDLLVFEAPLGGAVALVQHGREATQVDIVFDGEEGRCDKVIDFPQSFDVRVAGRVEGLLEGERAWVDVCRQTRLTVGADGRFSGQLTLQEGACLLHAVRVDGIITAPSETYALDPSAGDATGIVLHLPDHDVGGIGVPVRPHPRGMQVSAPRPGTPAEAAGLQAGDVIVAVDGISVEGFDLYEIIGAVTGPVGTTVDLTVMMREGGTDTIRVERTWISEGDWDG